MATTYSVPTTAAEWREAYALTPEREAPFSTLSGVPVKPLYTCLLYTSPSPRDS